MKKLFAFMLAGLLLFSAALAEITVGVDWVYGEEGYVTIEMGDLSMRYAEHGCYETADGLVWQVGLIPFGALEPLLMPQSEGEIRAMNGLYAALEEASGFWNKEAAGEGRLPVYSAPDASSYRGANGKAAVELSGGVRLLMSWDGWSLVEYQVSRDENRIGWVESDALGSAPVMLTDIAVALSNDAFLTDDPASSWRHVMMADDLTDVHLLAKRDAFWGYVSAKTLAGKTVWGFVPLRCIRLNDAEDAQRMAELVGSWGFIGGGELLGLVFTLEADGTAKFYDISDEALQQQTYLTSAIFADGQTSLAAQTKWAIVTGTAGHEHDLLLTYENGRVERFRLYDESDMVLTLTQGEAGGGWQRLEE